MSAAPASERYVLDTNIVGAIIRGKDGGLLQRLAAMPIGSVAISSVTLAEMEYGWQRAGCSARLRRSMDEFLLRADVLVWDNAVARCYGEARAAWEARGVSLSDLDIMIAAHAVSAGATLVSRDQAFQHVPDRLMLQVW